MSEFPKLEKKDWEVLLKLVANSLFKAEYTFEKDTDWQEVFSESIKQTVSAVALDGLGNTSLLPPELFIKWMSFAGKLLKQNVKVNADHQFLYNFLKEKGVPHCILKGSASEWYYPNPSLRAMGDVDFLVDPAELDYTGELFVADGFKLSLEEHECHRALKKEGKNLEMHFEPAGMPEGEQGEKLREILKDIFEKSTVETVGGYKFVKPSHLHHGIVILIHTYHHLLSEGIGLRHLCDWAVFANHFENDEFCEIFEATLKNVGLWKFAQVLSQVCVKYLAMPHKEWMGECDEALCALVIIDIMSGGNFGRKDLNRLEQGSMISNRGKNGTGGSKICQLIRNKNHQAAKFFPVFAKFKILYPFGWIFLGVRYVCRVITGKRKAVDYIGASKEADKRRQIYKNFELFEEHN